MIRDTEDVVAVTARLGKSVDALLSAAADVQLQAIAAINALEASERQSLSDRIDVLTRAPTDAMIEAGKGAWLDKRGFSDRDVLVAIYTAMTRAALHQEGIAP